MKRLSPFLLLLALGCGGKSVTVTVPPPPTCPVAPVQTVTITPGEVGVKYPLVAFAANPSPNYLVCGQIPPGMVVTAQSGNLWLSGTPTEAGTYKFWLSQ